MISIAVTPSCDQVIQLADRGAEGAFRREGADMQFVDHRLVPGPARQSASVQR